MATVNLGRIKPVFRGAYNNSTSYVVDDIVTFGNETFIAIQAGSGNATSNASFWTKLAAKGTDGTDVGTTITTHGDILFRDGSGLQRLAAGTSGFYLETKGAGQNPVWSEVTAKFVKAQKFHITTRVSVSTSTSDQNLWDFGTFAKQSSTSKLYYHGYGPGYRTENDRTFFKLKATPASGTAETDNHDVTQGAHSNSVLTQFFNLQGAFDTAFAAGNVVINLTYSCDGQPNLGHTSGMIFNPNNSDDSRLPSTSSGSHLVVYEIED